MTHTQGCWGGRYARGAVAWVSRVPQSRIIIGLYLVALAAVLAHGMAGGYRAAPRLLDADELEYWNLSATLFDPVTTLAGRRTMGFPLVIAACRWLHDDILFVQVAVSAIYAATAPLLFVLVRRLSGSPAAGALAGLVLALWPPAVFFGSSLYSEVLAAPIFVAALALLPTCDGAPRPGRVLAAGVLLGIATHVRPMYLLFLPCLALILLVEQRNIRAALGRMAVVVLGFAAVVGPWTYAVSRHNHRFILVTANGGETLAGGLNQTLIDAGALPPDVTPSGRRSWIGPGKWLAPQNTGYLSAREAHLPYREQDQLLRARTIAWLTSHPASAARLEWCKLSYMWGISGWGNNGAAQILFGNLPTLALLALALWAAIVTPERLRFTRLWLLPFFVCGVALISWGSWRFRQPGDLGLIGLVAVAVTRRVERPRADPLPTLVAQDIAAA